MSALWKGWAVVIKPTRGTEWSHPVYVGRTRAAAVAAYEGHLGNPGEFQRDRKTGKVRCIRVALRPSVEVSK